jgi:hypothetical protein
MPVLSRSETLELTPGYQYSIYSVEKNDNFLLNVMHWKFPEVYLSKWMYRYKGYAYSNYKCFTIIFATAC